jgi:hypothetical protein
MVMRLVMRPAQRGHVAFEHWAQTLGEQRHAVLQALAISDDDLASSEIDVADAQRAALRQAQARAVHETRHQAVDRPEPGEDGGDLAGAEHDG